MSPPSEFELLSIGGRRYGRIPALARLPGLVHAFSTRPDDISPRNDARHAERAGRRANMARDLGLDPDGLHYCHQVHRPGLAQVEADTPAGAHDETDGLLTTLRGAGLLVFSADCPLVLVVDAEAPVLGVAHASWRCTVADVVPRLIERMVAAGGRAERMHAGIGPSAGPEAYEVGAEVLEAAAVLPGHERFFPPRGERWCFDLWSANRAALERCGVAGERIHTAGVCTMTRTDLFYSYRREGAGCGHFGLLAGLVCERGS